MGYHQQTKQTTRILLFFGPLVSTLAILACSTASTTVEPSGVNKSTTPVIQTSTPVTSNTVSLKPTVSTAPLTPSKEVPINIVVDISIDQKNIKSGDTFAADFRIESKTELRGAQWKISFDPKAMRCDKITEGPFFKDWSMANGGETIIFPKPEIDNASGQISDMGIAVMTGTEGGASGSGIVCIYQFTAITDTIKIPLVSDIQLVDKNAKTVKAEIATQ